MAQFNYTKFLKEGGIEKYLMEADFGNDPQDRYDYIRPLMSRLPDTARTEYLIDALDQALADFNMTDDMKEKTEFDMIFIEIMKELGLESELMEAGDSLINPEAEEISPEDLEAASDLLASLAENDDVLDEILDEAILPATFNVGDVARLIIDPKDGYNQPGPDLEVLRVEPQIGGKFQNVLVKNYRTGEKVEYDNKQLALVRLGKISQAEEPMIGELEGEVQTENAEGDIQVGDLVYFKGHEDKMPMRVLKVRRMFGTGVNAITTEKGEYDETQLVRAKRGVDLGDGTFEISEMEGEVQSEEVTTKIGAVQKGNVLDAIKLLNHIQYEMADEFTDESMESLSDVIVMLGQVLKTFKK